MTNEYLEIKKINKINVLQLYYIINTTILIITSIFISLVFKLNTDTNNIILISIVFILVVLMVFFTYKNHMEKTIQTSSSPSKYEILVDVEESKLYLFEDGKLNKTYKCSGRKVVYSFTNRNMDYNFKRYMGRRLWR